MPPTAPYRTGLIVDWGGVLTNDMMSAVDDWLRRDGIDTEVYWEIVRDWLGEPFALEARINPIHSLERGEMAVPDFEARLADELTRRTGRPHVSDGLLTSMFHAFEHAPEMNALVHRAHGLGIRTALLSNSWGNEYPRDGWDDMFDVVVISGEVGMRKPDHDIFEHTLSLLELPASACVFVDDLRHNVAAAVELGMVGVHHESYDQTRLELEAVLGVDLG